MKCLRPRLDYDVMITPAPICRCVCCERERQAMRELARETAARLALGVWFVLGGHGPRGRA